MKKKLALLLSAILAVGMLASCGGSSAGSTASTGSTTGSSVAPVSYTHLDVYKRQLLDF